VGTAALRKLVKAKITAKLRGVYSIDGRQRQASRSRERAAKTAHAQPRGGPEGRGQEANWAKDPKGRGAGGGSPGPPRPGGPTAQKNRGLERQCNPTAVRVYLSWGRTQYSKRTWQPHSSISLYFRERKRPNEAILRPSEKEEKLHQKKKKEKHTHQLRGRRGGKKEKNSQQADRVHVYAPLRAGRSAGGLRLRKEGR